MALEEYSLHLVQKKYTPENPGVYQTVDKALLLHNVINFSKEQKS